MIHVEMNKLILQKQNIYKFSASLRLLCFSIIIIEYLGHPKNITAIIIVAVIHVLLYLSNLLKNYKLIPLLCHIQKIEIEF